MSIAALILLIIIIFHIGIQNVIEEIGSWLEKVIKILKKRD